jgi:hypothetical protein
MHCWCPPATGPNQPHQIDCVQYKRPIIHATIGSYYDWELDDWAELESEPTGPTESVDFIAEAQAYM